VGVPVRVSISRGEKLKTTFTSRYTDKPITAAQYLAERICERIAQREKTDLPFKFWNQTKWKRTFLYQVQIANGLLKIYRPEAIIIALRKTPKIYSLNAQFLDPLIRVEQDTIEKQERKVAEEPQEKVLPPVDITQKPRPAFTEKKSALNKLREL
jgi:hypothetical protein